MLQPPKRVECIAKGRGGGGGSDQEWSLGLPTPPTKGGQGNAHAVTAFHAQETTPPPPPN